MQNFGGVLANASVLVNDATCKDVCGSPARRATGGTIRIERADATVVSGAFEVTFPSGEKLDGTFSAAACGADLAATSSDAETCVP